MTVDLAPDPIAELRDRIQEQYNRAIVLSAEIGQVWPAETQQLLNQVERDAIEETHEWMASFITKKVNKLGRREAICPFVEPSFQKKAMFYSIAQLDEPDGIDSIDAELRHQAEIFHALEPKKMPDAMVKALVAIYPDTRGPQLLEATDPERDVKGDLLEDGILVGEFFSTCPFATSFNPKLFALRSPHPMYVLRTFIETDWRFISNVERWRDIYHDRFGDPPEFLEHHGSLRGRVIEKVRTIRDRLGLKQKRRR